MPKISVVIPVYNVEKYLARCLDSVLAQTFEDYEVVLVNDGATDSSPQICETYAQKHTRIRLYHKANGGLSDARNYGTERAQGEYIAYIDSDDYVSPEYLSCLYELLIRSDADVACCGYIWTPDDRADFSQVDGSEETVMDGVQACRRILCEKGFKMEVAWGKLYKKKLTDKHLFPVGRVQEDVATTFLYFLDSRRVAVTDRCLYGYFINNQGIQLSKPTVKRLDDALWSAFYRVDTLICLGHNDLAAFAINRLAPQLRFTLAYDVRDRHRWNAYYRKFMDSPLAYLKEKIKTYLLMRFPYPGMCYRKLYALLHKQ